MKTLFKIIVYGTVIFVLLLLGVVLYIKFVVLSYNQVDFDFKPDELTIISSYKAGDTILFKGSNSDHDTIIVSFVDTSQNERPGAFMALPASNEITVAIKSSPDDIGLNLNRDGTVDTVVNGTRNLIYIAKFPQSKSRGYFISYKDFNASCDTCWFGEEYTDTVVINGNRISNYYKLGSDALNKMQGQDFIETIYWTKKYGLTAYTYHSGVEYTIVLYN